VGKCKQLRKPNAYVIDMFAEVYFEDGVQSSRWKPKEMSFRNSSEISVYLLEDASVDAKKKLAEERIAYAKARKALSQQRQVSNDAFTLLGITPNITKAEFKLVKRNIMLKWHPDRAGEFGANGLDREGFLIRSKQYTDALSWVSDYLNAQSQRITK